MKCLIPGVVSLLSVPTALSAQAPSGGRFGGGEFIIACPGLSRDESTDQTSHTQRSSRPTRLLQRNTPYQYWRLNPPRFGANQETKATDQETREPVPEENQEEPTSYFGNDKLEEQPAVPLRTVVSMALQFEALPSRIAMTGHRTLFGEATIPIARSPSRVHSRGLLRSESLPMGPIPYRSRSRFTCSDQRDNNGNGVYDHNDPACWVDPQRRAKPSASPGAGGAT
jgi:hypothetical protein